MKIIKIPFGVKIFIIIALITSTVVLPRFFVRPEKNISEITNVKYPVDEHRIDSVLNTLTDSAKTGLFLFVEAHITNREDFNKVIQISRQFKIRSWKCSVPAFEYHSQISDSLKTFAGLPLTYAVSWSDSTTDAGRLPHIKYFTNITDTTFLQYFSLSYAGILEQHGINSVFLPPLFDSSLFQTPSLSYVNILSFVLNNIFHPNYFLAQQLIIPTARTTINASDSTFLFPGPKLTELFFQTKGYSLTGNIPVQPKSGAISIKHQSTQVNPSDFFSSGSQMLLININQVDTVFSLLYQYIKQHPKETEQKLKHIIASKLHSEDKRNTRKIKHIAATSTAWKTVQMQLSEHIICLKRNITGFFPLQQASPYFIVAKGCRIPHFHETMKFFDDKYSFKIISCDRKTTKSILEEAQRLKKPVIFIQDENNFFDFDSTLLATTSNTIPLALIDFSSGHPFTSHQAFQTVLIAGCNYPNFQSTAAMCIMGAANVYGTYFPDHSMQNFFPSVQTEVIRLKPSWPEDAGLNGDFVNHTIDSIITDAIEKGAFPGCQIFAAKNGKIVFNKAYGWHSYDREQTVKITDLYDVASVTKIAATTIAAMRMCDQGKLQLDQTMKKYFKNTQINYSKIKTDTIVVIDTINLKTVNLHKLIKEKKLPRDTFRLNDTLLICIDSIFSKATPLLNIFNVPIRFMLMHYSGIAPTLPILPFIQIKKYYLKELGLNEADSIAKNIQWNNIWNIYYSNKYSDSSTIQIADNIWLKNRWLDTLWQRTKEVGVSGKKYSQYTDLNMILVQMTIDTINKTNIDSYLQKEFYEPLGLRNIMYVPLKHGIPRTRIVPTENDIHWRKQVLRGYVHDPSAAMLGGISGNAGLFSNAQDLGILFQMLLNGGTYGGKRYLSEKIIKLFTMTQPETGRGLGFDKYSPNNIVAPSASVNTYGHTGFTGCCVWVDPDFELVYVFLSNRIHPNVQNQRINGLRIRQKVHQVFYDARIK